MRILLIILLTISFKVHAFESLFFFGKELGSRVDHDQLITFEDVENLSTSEEALDMYTKVNNLGKNSEFTFEYVPKEKNTNFSNYEFGISPMTGTISGIAGYGDSLYSEECDVHLNFYEKFYTSKYSDNSKYALDISKQTTTIWIGVRDRKAKYRKSVDEIFILFHCENKHHANTSTLIFSLRNVLFIDEQNRLIKKVLEKKEELLEAEANVNTDTTGL
jgi:hypothetical protein